MKYSTASAILNLALAEWTKEVSMEDFECAFEAMTPLRDHYPDHFLFNDVITKSWKGDVYHPHFYTEVKDGEVKYFCKCSTLSEYEEQVSLSRGLINSTQNTRIP